MSLTNIVIADAQATPVNHTFAPQGPDANGVEYLTDYSQSNAIGFWKISIQTLSPSQPKAGENSANRVYRVKIGLHEPILETLSNSTISGIVPAPTVSYIPRSFIEYVIPERSALLDRKNLWKMTHLLGANAQIQDFVENLTVARS
jgi:hypothetical protein